MTANQQPLRVSARAHPTLGFGAYSDKAGREVNEDSCTELQQRSGKEQLGVLAAIADGMGGGESGRTASLIAIGTLSEEYFEASAGNPLANLQQAVHAANSAVYAFGVATRKTSTVGTTIVAAAIVGDQAYLASVGDSRAYLVRSGVAHQITLDQNWAEQQVALGNLSRSEAEAHEHGALLIHVLGQSASIEVPLTGQPDNTFCFQFDLLPGDTLVLCSDGLSNALAPAELAAIATSAPAPRAAELLVRRAITRHTSDNATAVVLHYALRPGKRRLAALLQLLLAAGLVLGLAVGLLFLLNATPAVPASLPQPAPSTVATIVGTPNRLISDAQQVSATIASSEASFQPDATSTFAPTATPLPSPTITSTRRVVRPTRTPPPPQNTPLPTATIVGEATTDLPTSEPTASEPTTAAP